LTSEQIKLVADISETLILELPKYSNIDKAGVIREGFEHYELRQKETRKTK